MISGVALALKPAPAEAHPCQTPTQNFGIVNATVTTEYLLHGGDCATQVNGQARWMASFDFELAERRTVEIDLENVADVDPYLRLLDESGTVIASDDDSGDGLNARISRELNRGRYRIEATKYNARAGTVRLTIEVGPRSISSSSSTAVRALSAGAHHTCALLVDGQLRCWGWNEDGQSNARLGTFASVSAGLNHTCAIDTVGALRCWGRTAGIAPVSPEGRFTQVGVARFASTCAVTTGGGVQCWGLNNWGQSTAPTGRFTQVSAAAFHTCALATNGAIECWGRPSTAQNPPAGMFTQISANMFYTCALSTSGAARCWGDDIASSQANPPAVRFTQVDTGTSQACALTTSGEVRCWGGDSDPPTGRFSQVAVGAYHACAVRQDATVECWGSNHHGQLDVPDDLATPAEPAVAACPETPLIPLSRGVQRSGRLEHGDCLSAHYDQWADVYRLSVTGRILVKVRVVSDQAISPKTYLSKVDPITRTKERVRVDWLGLDATKTSRFEQWLDPGTYELEVTKVVDRAAAYDLAISPVMAPLHNEDFVHQIASLYAPTLHFSQGEKYFPTSVEAMLARSDLKRASDETLARRGTLSPDGLTSWNGQSTYLDLDDTDSQREARGPKVVYTVVADIDDGTVTGAVVQYWFFYLYNETLPDGVTSSGRFGAHEGDWEGIQLFFGNRRAVDLLFADAVEAPAPDAVGFASHDGGFAGVRIDQTAEDTGACGVLDVYVARNRHASYPQAGSGRLQGAGEVILTAPQGYQTGGFSALGTANGGGDSDNPLGGDVYRGDGESWFHSYTSEGERYDLRVIPTDATSWLWWDGKWGEGGAPQGPAFKSHFRNSPTVNFSDNQWWLASFSCEGGWTTHPTSEREPQLHESLSNQGAPGLATWLGAAETSASALLNALSGINSIQRWYGGSWQRYAVAANGQAIPGSVDFTIRRGETLWLSR